ncbi:uncharacterized protein LOC108913962 isoform X2 [Anoplophora glabripennis]|uniref:uncharacterized protein LOC108913962 isoform X2 n=1 Tax=Anoplophora glabripennis TaxID=217634 RepID=UPI0008757603|nr:uncharacterized protein LOC108913962 isoform X2 [Anoplophora glabripennis]
MSSAVVSVFSKTTNIYKELQRVLPNITFHCVQEIENDEQFRKSHIIVGDYDLIGPHIYNLPHVKLVQGTWAGIDALIPHIRSNTPPTFPIVRFTGNHFGRLIGEYVVACIVNVERGIFEMKENQNKQQWVRKGKITEYRSIFDLTIGILGVGNIGDKIGRLLNYMGATVFGYGRRDSIDLVENNHISQYFNGNDLTRFLHNCDYVVNVLPSTDQTKGLLHGTVLENCKERGTVFVNVGRGSVISEESLVRALQEKWISGAILDVFDNEPLREESLLWKMENVWPKVKIYSSDIRRSRRPF